MRTTSNGWGRTALRCALPLALVTGADPVLGQEVRWTGTVSFSEGEYVFSEPTRTLSLYTGLNLAWGRLDVGGSLPVVMQNSQLVSQLGGMPMPTGGPDHEVVGGRRPGETLGTRGHGQGGGGMIMMPDTVVTYRNEFSTTLGDPFFTAGMTLREGTGTLRSIRTHVSAKAPVRDVDSGVGTGEWDVGAGASAFTAFGGAYAFVDLSYWWYGDMPGLELADGLSYGVGLSRGILNARGSVMASFYGAHAIIDTMDRPAAIGLGLSYVPTLGRSLSAGLTIGLSEASPDFSVYTGWSLPVG